MEKGKLKIKIDSLNNHVVEYYLDNGTVWMDRNELCVLFGCYMKDIDRCIAEIFEKNMLRVEETCRYHIIAGGKRISYDITEVNLAVIITLAFRLDTPEAKTLRMWCVKQITKVKCPDELFFDTRQSFWWN